MTGPSKASALVPTSVNLPHKEYFRAGKLGEGSFGAVSTQPNLLTPLPALGSYQKSRVIDSFALTRTRARAHAHTHAHAHAHMQAQHTDDKG
jgi:hypothetical protein